MRYLSTFLAAVIAATCATPCFADSDPTFNGIMKKTSCQYTTAVACNKDHYCAPSIISPAVIFAEDFDFEALTAGTRSKINITFVSPAQLGKTLVTTFDFESNGNMMHAEILLTPNPAIGGQFTITSGIVTGLGAIGAKDIEGTSVSFYGTCGIRSF